MHDLGTLLGSWSLAVFQQDGPMPTDELLDEADGFLTCHFTSSTTAHAIAYDVQSKVWVNEPRILVVVTLQADIRLSRGCKTHPLLTSYEVQRATSCTMLSVHDRLVMRHRYETNYGQRACLLSTYPHPSGVNRAVQPTLDKEPYPHDNCLTLCDKQP